MFDTLFKSESSLVVSAPTGAGKTVVFVLAMIKSLMEQAGIMVYIAPIKALCSEKKTEFERIPNVRCLELTGDFNNSFEPISEYNVILTTPEKWDVVTRRLLANSCRGIIERVQLVMVDEVHVLSDAFRGHTLETVITRMKRSSSPRFIGVSATIPNAKDIAKWLETRSR